MALLWGGCVTRMFSHTVFKRSQNIEPNGDISPDLYDKQNLNIQFCNPLICVLGV
jgi:hypothetical protein